MRAKLRTAVTSCVVALAVVASAAPANASPPPVPSWPAFTTPPPGGFSSWYELFEVQARMNDALVEILAVADKLGEDGFGAATAAPENRAVELYWHGPVPPAVQAVIDRHRAIVPIVVKEAAYSRRQLLQAMELVSSNGDFYQIGPLPDASGLEAYVAPGRTLSASTQAALTRLSVPLTIREEVREGVPFSRQNDSPPYSAGARTSNCTTGFAVIHQGYSKLLYAAHCAMNGAMVGDGGGDLIGYVTNRNETRDTSLIQGPGQRLMWDGPYNETIYRKQVVGATPSFKGNWICTSGASSGVRCDIQVKAVDQKFNGYSPLVMAEHRDRQNAAGDGDSGGPVFELVAPGSSTVRAKGIISRGDGTTRVACTGITSSNRVCSWRFYYADVIQTLNYYGATLATLG